MAGNDASVWGSSPGADVVASTVVDEASGMVTVRAPVRVADVGGWTDTWFGAPGRVCHLPVHPGVTVEAELLPTMRGDNPVHLVARGVGAGHGLGGRGRTWADRDPLPGRHPLLEESIAALLDPTPQVLPRRKYLRLEIRSAVPSGASLGTSGAVVVALLAAIDRLLLGGERTPEDLARLAHHVEAARCGLESGVQDQWAAALGRPALLEVAPTERGTTPEVTHRPLDLSPGTLPRLDERLVTVVVGAHDSSAVHREVIDSLAGGDGDVLGNAAPGKVAAPDKDAGKRAPGRAALDRLSELAETAAAQLEAGDLDGWGRTLTETTHAQEALHPALTGPGHAAAIEVARAHGALGWKVNGAGGDGGSLTALAPDPEAAVALAQAWRAHDPSWVVPDLRLPPPAG